MIWYVRHGDRELGPLGDDALRALVGTGRVSAETPLWHEGLKGWTAAAALPGVLGPRATASAASQPAPDTPKVGIKPLYWATAGIFLIAIVVLLAWRLHPQHHEALNGSERTATRGLQQELTEAAQGVNASTPRMIDNMTRLDGAHAGPGTLFTYDYTLTSISAGALSSASLETLRRRLSADVRQTVCGEAALQPLLKAGAVVRFRYGDEEGQELAVVSISSTDCAQ